MSHPSEPNRSSATPKTRPQAAILRWRCPNCGQQIFTNSDEDPPDMCAYCRDMTTWQYLADIKPDENN